MFTNQTCPTLIDLVFEDSYPNHVIIFYIQKGGTEWNYLFIILNLRTYKTLFNFNQDHAGFLC